MMRPKSNNKFNSRFMIMMSIFSSGRPSEGTEKPMGNRKAYAAGMFFSGSKSALESDLHKLFEQAKEKSHENVRAIIVPHAGYSYSGIVAASGYKQLDPDREYEHIFVIATSHTAQYEGASIYSKGNYETPLGEVEVDIELTEKLIAESDMFSFQPKAHLTEHSLEVQLPFLQYYLNKAFKIIPIVIGTQDKSACRDIAAVLKPYFTAKNLFVISTDFSHFPNYKDAREVDQKTADAVTGNSKDMFLEVLKTNEAAGISNLATAMCGWSSVLTLLNLTEDKTEYSYHQVQYLNSGNAGISPDKSRVVGYWALAVTTANEMPAGIGFSLTEKDRADLLGIARLSMETYVEKGQTPKLKTEGFSENLKSPCGAFVTLTKEGELRGCIGNFEPKDALYSVVQQMAVAASSRDYRFSKVKKEEFADIELEISVLSPMKKITSVDEIELGKHGIYIVKGSSNGTFLPQVATETGWSLEEFLGHCARDKAKLDWEGWKEAEIYIYEALIFHE